jgi:hypothetical protein
MTRAADLAELGSAYAGVNSLSFRNKLINGNFDVWQRGTTFNAIANNSYTADRWLTSGNGTGGQIDVSRQPFSAPGVYYGDFDTDYYLRTTITTLPTGCTYMSQMQRIEAIRQLGGKRVTISFYARANATRSGSVGIQQNYGTGGSGYVISAQYSFTMTNTFQKFTFQYDIPSNVGKTIGTGACQEFFIQIVNPASGDYFDISQVQVELGSVVTPFEYRPYGLELSLCQRYYERSLIGTSEPCTAIASRVDMLMTNVAFKATKRIQPAVTIFSPVTLAAGKVRALDGSQVNTDVSASAALAHQDGIPYLGNSNAFVVGTHYNFGFIADAEL